MDILEKTYHSINLEYLGSICSDDFIMMERITILFLDTTPGLLAKLKGACEDEQWLIAHGIVHKLKSSFATFGANSISMKLERIESMTRGDGLNSIEKSLGELEELMKEIEREGNEVFKELYQVLEVLK